jgi:hypothetical protein
VIPTTLRSDPGARVALELPTENGMAPRPLTVPLALILALVLTGSLAGQPRQTRMWGDLKFGMTVPEARGALPCPSKVVSRRERSPGKSVPGIRMVDVPRGALGAAPVIAAIYFEGKPESLSGVLLASSHNSTNYCDVPGHLEKQAVALLWQTFVSELKKQNGEPSSSRTAPGENSGVDSMVAIWEGAPGYPDIKILLMGSCKQIDVTVTYAPAGSGKR